MRLAGSGSLAGYKGGGPLSPYPQSRFPPPCIFMYIHVSASYTVYAVVYDFYLEFSRIQNTYLLVFDQNSSCIFQKKVSAHLILYLPIEYSVHEGPLTT